MRGHIGILRAIERGLMAVGLVCLAVFTAGLVDREIVSRLKLRDFDRALAAPTAQATAPDAMSGALENVDFSRWSEQRLRAYRASVAAEKEAPLAVVRIRKTDLRIPVFEGTGTLALNRGAGWIPGTARPGEPGNVGIAGHRDGFFRGLKDLKPGDAIELETRGQTAMYTVDQIEIVSPLNIGVLRPRTAPSLTLVTCYPFYFIGNAPKRYVVHASLSPRQSAVHREIGKSEKKEKQR